MTDSRFLPVADLDPADRRAMRGLLGRHFLGVTATTFDADLADKTHALLIRRDGALVAFSTLAFYASPLAEGVRPVVCSGDTITDPSAWASPDLPRRWIAAVRSLPGGERAWWLLLCGGFRTYRLLPTFWRRFVPHHRGDDLSLLALRNALADLRFGHRFDPDTGIVRVANPTPLRPHLAGVPPQRRTDPHVAHFAALNPGHAAGDELACLCELSDDNLTAAGRRMVVGGGGR